jgi:hypothetical protein
MSATHAGVQGISDVFHIVDKGENVFVYTHIFNLVDNVEYVIYTLYTSIFSFVTYLNVSHAFEKMNKCFYKLFIICSVS